MTVASTPLPGVQVVGRGFGIVHVLMVVTLLFGSADLFFAVNLGGISFRLVQLLQLLLLLAGFAVLLDRRGRARLPLAFVALSCWGAFVVAWTTHTHHLAFSASYTLYFLFSYLFIFASVQLYAGRPVWDAIRLYRAYVLTFVAIALFGLFQFAAGLAGIDILVSQWWIRDVLPRVNGLSYEPSYFATYLLAGWGMLVWLVERDVPVFASRTRLLLLAIVTAALVLSSSRMALLMLGGYAAYALSRSAVLLVARMRLSRRLLLVLGFCAMVLVTLAGYLVVTFRLSDLLFLLEGTGVGGTSSHSVSTRLVGMSATFEIFRDSPLFGYGLGGVWSELAYRKGGLPGDVTGMNVSLEVLAASGLVGFVFFVLYLCLVVHGCFLARRVQALHGELMGSLGLGFLLIFGVLQFNQGILRIYFWNHLAVIAVLSMLLPLAARRRA